MRTIERHDGGTLPRLRRTKKRDDRLTDYLTSQLEDALSARAAQDQLHAELLRMYKGVPKTPYRHVPIENAPNLEVTIGATEVDGIYAQATELLFTISPTVTARATPKGKGAAQAEAVLDAKAVQKWTNWGTANEWGLRPAADQVLLEDVQLGTGVYYTPWMETVRVTDVAKVVDVGPKIIPVPSDDFIVPGGAYADIEDLSWVDMRSWLTEPELQERKKLRKWDITNVTPAGHISYLRQRREDLAQTHNASKLGKLYEIHDVYVRFDYDGDGYAEDLLAIFDRSSRTLCALSYQPYDTRPFSVMRYQLQPFLFYGLGVLEMMRPFQEEVTEIHNQRLTNSMLANNREFKARPGTVRGGVLTRYPGKVHEMNDPVADLIEMKMSDVYPSAGYNEEQTTALAQRRVGANPTQGSSPLSSSRTPGVTAATFLQMQNRRFVPAFDSMRLATSQAVVQCVQRYRERLLAGDLRARQQIVRVVGEEDAARIERVLVQDGFSEMVTVELTASSAMLNRESDKQNALALVNVFGAYSDKTLQYMAVASNPQTPPPVREAAMQAIQKGSELMDRTFRTFDQMRDPEAFVIDVSGAPDAVDAHLQNPLVQMQGLIGMFTGEDGGASAPTDLGMNGTPLPNSGTGIV